MKNEVKMKYSVVLCFILLMSTKAAVWDFDFDFSKLQKCIYLSGNDISSKTIKYVKLHYLIKNCVILLVVFAVAVVATLFGVGETNAAI